MQKWMLIEGDQIKTGDESLFAEWQASADSLLWVDIQGSADDNDRRVLNDMLVFPEAEVVDALRDRHPPRFGADGDFLFLLMKPLDSDSKTLDFDTQQMAVLGGPNFVVTRHNKHSGYLDALWSKVEQGERQITSLHQVFALLARRMVNRYGRVLLDLEDRLDSLEDELMEDLDETHMQELVRYNTSLRKMRRILNYHVTVTEQLARHAHKKGLADWVDEFDDISSQVERFNSLAELYQNVINDLIEGYISLNAHHLNQVMKILTVVTVVFLPLSLLVGIYGMNFEYMPELKAHNGYYILIAVMIGIASTLAFIFRRMKWL